MDSPTKAELEDAIELTPVVAKHEATNAPLRKPPPGQISLPEVPRHFVDSASSTPGTALNTPGLGPLTPTSSRLAFLLPSDSPSGAKNAIALVYKAFKSLFVLRLDHVSTVQRMQASAVPSDCSCPPPCSHSLGHRSQRPVV